MSLTFLAKSSAYSWKMSLDGQVLCQRIVIGPACPLAIIGKPSAAPVAAAPVAAFRKLRREPCWRTSGSAGTSGLRVMLPPKKWRLGAVPGTDALILPEFRSGAGPGHAVRCLHFVKVYTRRSVEVQAFDGNNGQPRDPPGSLGTGRRVSGSQVASFPQRLRQRTAVDELE